MVAHTPTFLPWPPLRWRVLPQGEDLQMEGRFRSRIPNNGNRNISTRKYYNFHPFVGTVCTAARSSNSARRDTIALLRSAKDSFMYRRASPTVGKQLKKNRRQANENQVDVTTSQEERQLEGGLVLTRERNGYNQSLHLQNALFPC